MQKSITSQEYIKANQILTIALTTGAALFMGVAFYLQKIGAITLHSAENKAILKIIFPLCAVFMVAASTFISQKMIHNAQKQTQLSHKLRDYRTAILIKFALLEGSSLFLTLGYWFTNQIVMLFLAIFIIAAMALNIQQKERIMRDLTLTEEEIRKMENPNEVVMMQEVNTDD